MAIEIVLLMKLKCQSIKEMKYLKRGFNRYKEIIFLVISVVLILFLAVKILHKGEDQLVYDYKKSIHHELYFENGYVVFRDEIKVRNTTSEDIYFNMSADVSEDTGLVVGDTAIACKKDSLQKEKFLLKANSQQTYTVYFKAKKGKKDTKLNRLPPKKVFFILLK